MQWTSQNYSEHHGRTRHHTGSQCFQLVLPCNAEEVVDIPLKYFFCSGTGHDPGIQVNVAPTLVIPKSLNFCTGLWHFLPHSLASQVNGDAVLQCEQPSPISGQTGQTASNAPKIESGSGSLHSVTASPPEICRILSLGSQPHSTPVASDCLTHRVRV